MRQHRTRSISLVCAVVAAMACGSGDKGEKGAPGVTTGTISGTLTYQPNPAKPLATALPASNVFVSTIPDVGITATTDAAGVFELGTVPVGVYSVVFSGTGWAKLQIDGVAVIATKNTVVNALDKSGQPLLQAVNPIVLTAPAASAPAGFDAPVSLAIGVAGGTPPYTYKWVPATANPTPVALSSDTADKPTFRTGKLADILASGKSIGFGTVTEDVSGVIKQVSSPQVGFLSISNQQLTQMSYSFTVTVTDSVGFVKTATVAVPPATLAQGNSVVPIGQIVVANLPDNTLEAGLSVPEGSKATLFDAKTKNPWFIPDVKGNYVVRDYLVKVGSPLSISVHASTFQGSNPNCGGCHNVGIVDKSVPENVAAKFKAWANSAHGNHFFKFMEYDKSGNLVWKLDANGKPLPAPTANPTVFWDKPGAMTTFQFGMVGAEGTHYSASCVACHTTGYNALASNGGTDDLIKAKGYAFPNLANFFTKLTGVTSQQVVNKDGVVTTATYDPVTAAPVSAPWDVMPAEVKAMAGMQCESCHGPLGSHATAGQLLNGKIVKPVAELNPAACAGCHDRPSNHDRVSLWRQSRHANLERAIGEAADHNATNGGPDANCGRCHAAQGFVQYVKQLNGELKDSTGKAIPAYWGPLGNPGVTPFDSVNGPALGTFLSSLGMTKDQVQPVTCGACHDAHTTGLRVEGETPMLAAGFKVTGVGAGALCFVCHNSRNGARGDGLTAFYNSDLPSALPTAIGTPHASAQGDVIAGKNAFFVGAGYNPSAHLSVEDGCVGCHMKTFRAGLTGTNTNHTWKIDSTSCGKCHGSATTPVDGEALQSQFDGALKEMQAVVKSAAEAAFATQVKNGLVYKGSVRTVAIPTDATATFSFGRNQFVTKFATAIDDPNKDGATITSLNGAADNFYAAGGVATQPLLVFAKANWNNSLVSDGSRGIHNPTFVFEVISATKAAVAAK